MLQAKQVAYVVRVLQAKEAKAAVPARRLSAKEYQEQQDRYYAPLSHISAKLVARTRRELEGQR